MLNVWMMTNVDHVLLGILEMALNVKKSDLVNWNHAIQVMILNRNILNNLPHKTLISKKKDKLTQCLR